MADDDAVDLTREQQIEQDDSEQEQPVATVLGGPPEGPPEHVSIPEELPILPLRDSVAFPGTIMPLTVGREKSRRLVDSVLTGNKIVGLVAQRFSETEDPELGDLYRVGTAVMILRLLKMPDGSQSIVVHGLSRFGLESLIRAEPFMVGKANVREDRFEPSTELDALVHNCRHAAGRVVDLSPNVADEAKIVLTNIDQPGALADFLAANLSISLVHKQELLETFDVTDRLRKVHAALATQLEVLELSDKLQTQVKEQIGESQRQYYLREQLKVIQKELGQLDQQDMEIQHLKERITKAKMPDSVQEAADREVDRLSKIPTASPEYSVAMDYVDWLCRVPWSVSTEDQLDIARAERVLDHDHYGLEKVKKRIVQFLAVRKLNPHGRGSILCFVGPPGVGKTSLGQSIARAMGRKFIRMSVGGMRDEADIRGHRRTYIGSLPGRIVQEIVKAKANNPVFMLDEVDKIGADFRGDPAAALLEVLDPQQNHSFTDHYLDVPLDLSRVMFIATANYIDPVIPALQDRMEVIELPGYTEQDKLHIARRYLVPRQLSEHGLGAKDLRIENEALLRIVEGYTREAGVRNLERQIAGICRAVAVQVARGKRRAVRVTARTVSRYLGPERFEPETASRTSVPGVATGLAFTPAGGTIIFVEATRMPGKGGLILTGQIGDVMRESAQAAFSLVRSRGAKLGVHLEKLASCDIHIHVPAGAVPKDGPSAGVAMLAALVSLCSERPVRSDVAMTGEVTLRGLVLPVGGIKEKVLAAERAGIGTIILPQRNKNDLADVPKEAREKLDFVFASRVEDVLKAALEPPPARAEAERRKKTRAAAVGKAAKKAKRTARQRARGAGNAR